MPITYTTEHSSTPLKMFRGDTYTRSVNVVQNGSAFNLTGYDVRMTFKYRYEDADGSAVFTLTSNPASGITVTSAAGGVFSFTISKAKTLALPARKVILKYDAQISNTTNVYTILWGELIVYPDVSVTEP